MRHFIFLWLVAAAFITVTSAKTDSTHRINTPSRVLRSFYQDDEERAIPGVESVKNFFKGSRLARFFKKSAQQGDDEVAKVAKLEKENGAKVSAAASETVKKTDDDIAKVVSETAKKDDGAAKLISEVAKKDDDVAKAVSGAANQNDEVAKLTKLISAGEKTDENAVRLAAGVATAAKMDRVPDQFVKKLSKQLAEEMKNATPKKMSLLRKLIYLNLGVAAGVVVYLAAKSMLSSNTAAAPPPTTA
ncbi:unnamed protein product [Phytophthora fragariaefolia]|uniref:Unnamed protein product n=1 Tax=Phytophthora fragariaefolia TaxID=1490495 RepID=A0A9W7CPD3_9STRA|nr:unnamed protein product [Phytophthora fragariaefolia]